MKQAWLWGAYVSCIQPKDYKFPVGFARFSTFSARRPRGYHPRTTVLRRAVHLCRSAFCKTQTCELIASWGPGSPSSSRRQQCTLGPHDGANSSRATVTGRPRSAQSAHAARAFVVLRRLLSCLAWALFQRRGVLFTGAGTGNFTEVR